ncbi:MAG: hypothetical protein WCH37_08895 [Synechococcaceae cyanobacterium ELA182]
MTPPVHLQIGCQLNLRCEVPTPVLALVHPHTSLLNELRSAEGVGLHPDRSIEVLSDQAGNRWCRLMAPSGVTQFRYATTIVCSDRCDPVLPSVSACPIQALPIETYRFLNASTYCDPTALMAWAWTPSPMAPVSAATMPIWRSRSAAASTSPAAAGC